MPVIRVIDFETTGEAPPAEVCEVGFCDFDVDSRAVGEPVSWLCGVKHMPPDVRAVHHISLQDCEGRPPFSSDVIQSVLRDDAVFGPPVIFAAHNAKFELQFFDPRAPMICTFKAALRVWPDAPAHNNGALRYWLQDQGLVKLDHERSLPAHRAGPDAYVTAHLLKALFEAGATGREMVAWTREPALLPRCPIGKFRGMEWCDVEWGFLNWMTRQADMDEDLKWLARMEMRRRDGQAAARLGATP